ncbi:DUF2927 domain-containing protein [Jannaschia seohaensis]|uniref:Uncharacterized protein n=1 Tax=Jannaschia seohaensis TaxID=475081 RepID=A0A2Y9BW69_9RHOB|nr:DUF2927 domain-containing protein [Jannaschia seohaensis]PWJ22304.1 Protein of unknown function (DUF2927) [Jannaschia seohaensis]SSA38582.1 Protein of unknown function [Jannaschia seohaensis]
MRLAALALLATPLAAQEFVEVPGRLSDEAFYRAVACGAPPEGACRKPFLLWPEEMRADLTVGLASAPDDLPPFRRRLFETGVEGAIAEINGLGAGLRLRRDDIAPAIEIHIVDTPPWGVMTRTGVPLLDGALLPLALVVLRPREGAIGEALIAISAEARRREIASVLLEEITQSLGLMTDIAGPAYDRSLFSETGNSVTRLTGQDAMAVRRHYPPFDD